MYYWAKFVKQDVSIVIKNRLQHWVPGDLKNKRPHKAGEVLNALEKLSIEQPRAKLRACKQPFHEQTDFTCYAPYRDYAHFSGSDKPWQQRLSRIRQHTFYKIWFQELEELNNEFHMNLDLKNWDEDHLHTMKDAPLGKMAMWTDRAIIVKNHNGNSSATEDTKTTTESTESTTTFLPTVVEEPPNDQNNNNNINNNNGQINHNHHEEGYTSLNNDDNNKKSSTSTNPRDDLETKTPSTVSVERTFTSTESADVSVVENSSSQEESVPSSPFAYAFVLGGIHEDRHAYKGFLYDVLIATKVLRKLGSTADFWIWTQLSPDSNRTTLPTEDVRLLTALNIHISELEKPAHESFAQVVYSKFRLLQMTQYQRVMFLDADIMPLVNLDYLFHLSMGSKPQLRPNLILATRGEPCNTALFIVQPLPGDWESLQQAVHEQHEAGKKLPYPHFDWQSGWGYNFLKLRDQWEAINKNGTGWRFHAGHSDQGECLYFEIATENQTWGVFCRCVCDARRESKVFCFCVLWFFAQQQQV